MGSVFDSFVVAAW